MTAMELFAETVRLAKKKKRHDDIAGIRLTWAEKEEILCEFDPDSSVASIRDPNHVDEEHNQIPWDEQDYEEPPWWEVPDLDDDDALTALCKKVMAAGDTEMDQKKAEKVESHVINFALKLKNKSVFRKLSSKNSEEKKKTNPIAKAATAVKRRSFIKEVAEEKKTDSKPANDDSSTKVEKNEEPAKSSSVPSWKKPSSKTPEESSSKTPAWKAKTNNETGGSSGEKSVPSWKANSSAKQEESTSASSSVPSWKAKRQAGAGASNKRVEPVRTTNEVNGSSSKPVPAWKAKQKEAENNVSKEDDVADKPVPAWKARRAAQAKRTISEPVNSGKASAVRSNSAPDVGGRPDLVKDCSNSSSVFSLIAKFEK